MKPLPANAGSAEGGSAPATVMVVFIPLPDVVSMPRRGRHMEPRDRGHLVACNHALVPHGRAIMWMCNVGSVCTLGVVALLPQLCVCVKPP